VAAQRHVDLGADARLHRLLDRRRVTDRAEGHVLDPGVEQGLQELRRVLKANGRAAILEFSRPVVPGFRLLAAAYCTRVLPRIGGLISGSRSAYEYLPDSVSRFPDQEKLSAMMSETGFADVGFENLTGGVAALHTGRRA